jgi:hypothetical protein
MKLHVLLPTFLSLMALACGSGSGGGGDGAGGGADAGPAIYCYNPGMNVPATCTGSLDTPQASVTGTEQSCTEGDGQLVDACPTAGLVGCCQTLSEPSPAETCYYAGQASDLASQCTSGEPNYTWSTTSF